MIGEEILWSDPDLKLPQGAADELNWWVPLPGGEKDWQTGRVADWQGSDLSSGWSETIGER